MASISYNLFSFNYSFMFFTKDETLSSNTYYNFAGLNLDGLSFIGSILSVWDIYFAGLIFYEVDP